jgi:transketolase
MRAAFVGALAELAENDHRIVLLTGDLGFTVVEPFAERFPARFFNAGVAEQNMVGLATGLAEAGFRPFVYSIATFATLRPYEFVRNGPIHQHLPVRLVGVGGGLEYGPNGISHHALEDIALMRVQPGMTVVAPADHAQARAALFATTGVDGPIYFRLGKNEAAAVPGLDGRFGLGRAEQVGDGDDVVLTATGAAAVSAAGAVEPLLGFGVRASLLVVASISPPPLDDLVAAVSRVPVVVTVEAHYVVGGLGSLVSEIVAERGLACRVVRCGVRGTTSGVSGSEQYLHEVHGLTPRALADTTLRSLSG